jgi:hypothetical protein
MAEIKGIPRDSKNKGNLKSELIDHNGKLNTMNAAVKHFSSLWENIIQNWQPSRQIVILCLFLIAWLSPVILSLLVASQGLRFSGQGINWQDRNIVLVGKCVLLALIAGMVFGIAMNLVLKRFNWNPANVLKFDILSKWQNVFLFAFMMVSGLGLWKSFGGMIFQKAYEGPVVSWLDYGAWSVTFLICLCLLFGNSLAKRGWHWAIFFISCLLFVPFLLSGGRMDFMSFLLIMAIHTLVFSKRSLLMRTVNGLLILALGFFVCTAIAQLRSVVFSTILESVKLGRGFVTTVQAVYESTYHCLVCKKGSNYFDLSTLGDSGVSVFQTVGLIQQHTVSELGLYKAVINYSGRLLPGPIFHERPLPLILNLYDTEHIGGGAFHAIAEGYYIMGLGGCLVIGVFFGFLGMVSGWGSTLFLRKPCALHWIIFAFPWLILIRGGWYDFFAVFKTAEILVFVLSLVLLSGLMESRFPMIFRRLSR